MAMTNAEKQARYRVRKIEEGDGERLQAVVSVHAKRSIERLARHNGMTQAAMLEKLIMLEQRRVTADMDDAAYRNYVGEAVTV